MLLCFLQCLKQSHPWSKGWEKIPVWQFWEQNFHICLKGTDTTLDLFLCHQKKKHFLFKVVFPLALRIFFLMVQWVSCERERSWLESKNTYSLLKPVRAQERCVPSCHIWLWISQRSLHLNWFISVKKNNLKSLNVNKLYNSFLKLMFANNQTRRC